MVGDERIEVRYTRHARQRLRRRRVTHDEVVEVLMQPQVQYTDRGGNPSYVAEVAGRALRVVVAKDSEPPLIITVIVRGD